MSAARVAVVGAGISGLTAGWRLLAGARAAEAPLELTVLEAEARAGGHAWTTREDGFLVEAGPNAVLDRAGEPHALELARELGLASRLIEARSAARRRYVLLGGRLRRVLDSPPALIGSDVLSIRGKLRLMLEPFVPRAPRDMEETVAAFARRRLGAEAAEVLVDSAVAGISAGDSRALSVAAAFPSLVEMERRHGSLLRAMLARRERPSRLVSFDSGMATLVDALRERLGGTLRTSAPVRALAREGSGLKLLLADGGTIAADRVILAVPAWRAAAIVRDLDPALGESLAAIPFAGLAMVALAFRETSVPRPLDGYGYLVARREQLETLGVVWESSLFEGRAPQGAVLLRAMLGGARRPEVVMLPEPELIERARRELAPVLGITEPPLRAWVRRWPAAIAQYGPGHLERVRAARELGARLGLELCGTSYDGVSFQSAIASANAAASSALAALERPKPPVARGSPLEPPRAPADRSEPSSREQVASA